MTRAKSLELQVRPAASARERRHLGLACTVKPVHFQPESVRLGLEQRARGLLQAVQASQCLHMRAVKIVCLPSH